MAKIDKPTTTADLIYRGVKETEEGREGIRAHLGASQIGKSCTRELWYQFRWAAHEEFDGRMYRLFRRGKDEEEKLTADLRKAGIEVIDKNPSTGQQWRFEALGGHFGAELDAIGRGFPEDTSKTPKWHDLEYKTSNAKGFAKMKRDGVQKAKPQHYAQMQVGMHLSGPTNDNRMTRAMYLMVCKDTDEIHSERVKYVQAEAKQLMERAEEVIFTEEPLARVSDDPTWYECGWCTFKDICHGQKLPAPTCRSCAHVTACKDGTWTCADKDNDTLDVQAQWFGCGNHVYNPMLLKSLGESGDMSSEENWIEYTMEDGRKFRNGTRRDGVYASSELYHLDPALIGDENIAALRAQFDASVVKSTSDGVTLDDMKKEAAKLNDDTPFDDDIPF